MNTAFEDIYDYVKGLEIIDTHEHLPPFEHLREKETDVHAGVRHAASMSGSQVFASLAAIVLGILAVIGLSPLILILVALLTLGVASLLNTVAALGRVAAARS